MPEEPVDAKVVDESRFNKLLVAAKSPQGILIGFFAFSFGLSLLMCGGLLMFPKPPAKPKPSASVKLEDDFLLWIKLARLSQDEVSKFIKFPDTAIWKGSTHQTNRRLFSVAGKVQSKNAFGVPSTNSYQVDWHVTNSDSFTLARVIIADKVAALNEVEFSAAMAH